MNKQTVVVAHYDENLDWIKNIKTINRTVVVASRSLKDADIYQEVNMGYEASLYLEYIIKHYDQLDEYTFFVHGHRTSGHHDGCLDHLINGTKCTVPYKNINKENEQHYFGPGDAFYAQMHAMIGGEIAVPDDIPYFRTHRSAMFYVHRDLILRHPKEHYQKWLDNIMKGAYIQEGITFNDKSVAILFEWMWCFIFTGYLDEFQYKAGVPCGVSMPPEDNFKGGVTLTRKTT